MFKHQARKIGTSTIGASLELGAWDLDVRPRRAFTLIEMLTVIAIIGIIAALSVPVINNFGKSNVTVSASRQMLDAVGYARQLAMSQRTTVYMVFVPTNFCRRSLAD